MPVEQPCFIFDGLRIEVMCLFLGSLRAHGAQPEALDAVPPGSAGADHRWGGASHDQILPHA